MPAFSVKNLQILLLLIALHSFLVGLALLFLPSSLFVEFGYSTINENFFRAQGGALHLVMVAAYLIAAKDPVKNKALIKLAIIAKMIATVFLLGYYFIADPILTVLFSGVADFLMGAAIYFVTKTTGILYE